MNRTVPITMPDWMWGRLATIAEYRKTDIPSLIGSALDEIVAKDPDRLAELRTNLHAARSSGWRTPHSNYATGRTSSLPEDALARISELRDNGYSDSLIASDLGISRYQVQYHRTKAGIPPRTNRKDVA